MTKSIVMRLAGDNHTIGVVVSPRYGAGWSTWNAEIEEFLCLDALIVDAVLKKDWEAVLKRIEAVHPNVGVYDGGLENCVVEWVPEGSLFRIDEYDGFETVVLFDETDFYRA